MSSSGNSRLRASSATGGGTGLFAGTDARSGAAFLWILILASVLSVGVISFLSFSSRRLAIGSSDDAAARAAALAALAQAHLIGNLKNEMAAGFANPTAPEEPRFLQVAGPGGPVNILYPADARGSVPARTGPLAPPNLLKWSTRFAPFYTETHPGTYPWRSRFPPAQPASPVSTGDKSANGKSVTPKRWNASWLLPKRSPVSVDPTPETFPVPDWICLSARGEQRNSLLSQQADPIVGRYAYLIFDEGGLLDSNVAGFASSLDPSVVAAKVSTRVADLRLLFEAGGFSPAEATECNDAFVRWRDAGFFDSGAGTYSGLVQALGPPTPGRLYPGNSALVSRGAMIRLFVDRLPGRLAPRQNALQYLGTFSRALSQPQLALGWPRGTPSILAPEKGGNDGAGWNEGYPNHAQHLNPPFAFIRVRTPFFRRDGTAALVGEPLVKKRFSLTWLGRIQAESTANNGSPFERLFGLSRQSAADPWVYRPAQRRILTLNEVAGLEGAAAREPDFLELLKASILSGSLAKNSGIPSLPPDDSLDEAVVQIAANIIDQADRDAFPTRIQFQGRGEARVFSGVENLPYLAGVSTRVGVIEEAKPSKLLRKEDGSPAPPFSKIPPTDLGEVVLWQALQVWSPHEISSALLAQNRPEQFRISVEATDQFRLILVQETPMVSAGSLLAGTDPSPPPCGPRVSGAQVCFNLSPQSVAAFHQPERLASQAAPGGIQLELGTGNFLPPGGLPCADGKLVFGVGLARGAQFFQTGTVPSQYTVRASKFVPDPAVQLFYRLEYNAGKADEEPVWIAYDEKMGTPLAGVSADGEAVFDCWPDPRTPRFGAFPSEQSLSEAQTRARFFQNIGEVSGAYADADGVRRRGAGASGTATSPLDSGGRPRVLDRPFRSVGELAFAFAGTPWRHLDFATPESGFAGLLETFCVGENTRPDALEMGRVNLNTRQVPVLQAVLSGADLSAGDPDPVPLLPRGEFSALSLARALVARTGGTAEGTGPLRDLSDLVGRRGGAGKYAGLAADLPTLFAKAPRGGTSVERHLLARTLGGCGDTRVWNLLFDIIAQAGRFPPGAQQQGDLRNFVVEAEHRIWVHVAMDRLTGEVLDLQTEEVFE